MINCEGLNIGYLPADTATRPPINGKKRVLTEANDPTSLKKFKATPFNDNQAELEGYLSQVPHEIIFKIFQFLSPLDLLKADLTNKVWHAFSREFLQKNNLLKKLRFFLDSVSMVEEIHYPKIKYANFTFSIGNGGDITVSSPTGNTILENCKNCPIHTLKATHQWIFALREDGLILQFDYLNKKLVKTIDTFFSKQQSTLPSFSKNNLAKCQLHIIEDRLILSYNVLFKSESYIEIISYNTCSPNKRFNLSIVTLLKASLSKNHLYLIGENSIWSLEKSLDNPQLLLSLDSLGFNPPRRPSLTGFAAHSSRSDRVRDLCISEKQVYILSARNITIYDFENKTRITHPNSYNFAKIEVIHQLLLGYPRSSAISVLNLSDMQLVAKFPFHSSAIEWMKNTILLENLSKKFE